MKNHARLVLKDVLILLGAFAALALALVGRELIKYGSHGGAPETPLLSREEWDALNAVAQDDWSSTPECLYISDGAFPETDAEAAEILKEMKVSFSSVSAEDFDASTLSGISTAMLNLEDLGSLGGGITDLLDWVEKGGGLMIYRFPKKGPYLEFVAGRLGILGMDEEPADIEGIHFPVPFMIGGTLCDYEITDADEASTALLLDESCEVYMESSGERPVPLIWKKSVGEGCAVVMNFNLFGKQYRGFRAAAYSLLGDAFAWPVINGSAFFLDDFPAPVPYGEDRFIARDYGLYTMDFMTRIWWPEMQELAKKHGILYTGTVIESYSDDVSAPFERNNADIARHRYFGDGILSGGGELGYHGYNHMPLVAGAESGGEKQWSSSEDILASLEELKGFCKNLFPDENFRVFAPAANILSENVRRLITARFPEIRVISSVYIPEGELYSQEFDVGEDGVVNIPKVTSGTVTDSGAKLAALSELNFHYVNSHSVHVSDVLDPNRGASSGWEEMYNNLSGYMDWLYGAAPDIERRTASGLAAAVQRSSAVTVKRTLEENCLKLSLGNFNDEAYFLVRLNGHEPSGVSGGELTRLQQGLYLLKAESSEAVINFK